MPAIIKNVNDPESLNSPDDSAHEKMNAWTLKDTDDTDEDGHYRRKGNYWTAAAHIITAVIGSGILSLAWATSTMGWIAGPIILLMFAAVTLYCSWLLADAYRHPRGTGRRTYTYPEAVSVILGGWYVYFCGITQYLNLVGTGIGYTITAGIAMVAVRRSNCFHTHEAELAAANESGDGPSSLCQVNNNPFMLIFGAFQLLLSQIPDFDRLWFLSILAAVMSFSYASIGFGLAVGKATEHDTGFGRGSITGYSVAPDPRPYKVWDVLNGLGSFAFAYSFSNILIEIADTVKPAPTEASVMRKATTIATSATTLFYLAIAVVGYAAFGDSAPGNLLTGFGFFNPYWLVDLANVFIMVHLLGAYQVYTMPWYAFVETQCYRFMGKSWFTHKEIVIPLPILGSLRITAFRLIWRSAYVCFTTVIAMLLPFFNDVVGLLGSLGFWPLTVFLPIEMHIVQANVRRFSPKWCVLQTVSAICFCVTVGGCIGSIAQLKIDVQDYVPFKTQY